MSFASFFAQLLNGLAVDRGRIVAAGSPRDLIAASAGNQHVALTTSRPLAQETLAAIPGIEDLRCDGPRVTFRTAAALPVLTALGAVLAAERADIIELHVQKASLEDVFLQLTAAS